MAEFDFNNNDVFGGVKFEGGEKKEGTTVNEFGSFFETPYITNQANTADSVTTGNTNNKYDTIEKNKAITKQGLWSKIKAFLFQEIDLTAPIKVELTPYQQKIEDEINDFLHQDVSFKAIAKLFK